MYVPRANRMQESDLRPMVEAVGSAELVTVAADGFPTATRLPILWQDDRLILHMAVANPHWRSISDGSPAIAVVTGPEAYITPQWYAGKAEHGRVVPTWNYSAVHFRGRATVRRDAAWLLAAVTDLTDRHEAGFAQPWSVDDAPEAFIDAMLKAIVGIDFTVEGVEAKAKRSQNRSVEDRRRVIEGLRDMGDTAMADHMARDLSEATGPHPAGEQGDQEV